MWLQSRLPASTLTFALAVFGLVAIASFLGWQTRQSLGALDEQQAILDEAVGAAEELQIILLRLEDGRATATTVSGAMRARLERAKNNRYLAQSSAAHRLADELGKSAISVGDMLQHLTQLQVELHQQAAELRQETTLAGREAARDLWLVSTILIAISLVYVGAAWRHSRQLGELAATARRIRNGDLRARAATAAGGEVAELANDFNEMVEILADSLAQEERHVAALKDRAAELEAANQHKSRFLANVSHEFKTPLGAILGFAQILEANVHGPLTPKQRDYLARIGTAGKHLNVMIADLIDAARIDLASLRLSPRELNVEAVLAEVVDLLEPGARSAGIELTSTNTPPAATLFHDPERLRQILINVIGNAIKFTPNAGRVAISANTTADTVIFTVDDDGPGIPADQRLRVFDDFVQLDDTLDRRHDGTGMGLAISQRLAGLMGGKVHCDASPTHKGARFFLALPTRQTVDDL